MKRILLIVVVLTHCCNLQAMPLREKIKTIFPKSYVLSAFVRKPTNEEKATTEKKAASPKNIGETSFATSITATNNEEFYPILYDITQSPSELTITSSVSDKSGSSVSDYILMTANQIKREEEVFTSSENRQSSSKFESAVPFSDQFCEEEGIFDIEMSDNEQASAEHSARNIVSEEYFPIYHRENQQTDAVMRGDCRASYGPMSRRKSSTSGHVLAEYTMSEEYFPIYHRENQRTGADMRGDRRASYGPMSRRKSSISGQALSGYTMSEEYFPIYHRENQTGADMRGDRRASYGPMNRRKSSISGQALAGYTMSKEYFPIYYRENQQTGADMRGDRRASYGPMSRRKSSIDMYYNRHK